ncbi:MAG TPA: hypothetical protein VHE61_14200 [Opitutaceae bacterium]|nr:hypothetical protein [Opitutaceae bacterium]
MFDIQAVADSVLLTISLSGGLTKEVILGAVREHYPRFQGPLILWDLSRADLSAVTRLDFSEIARTSRELRSGAGYGKTAYVATDRSTYARLCLYMNEAVAMHVPAEYCVFRTIEEARSWLSRS